MTSDLRCIDCGSQNVHEVKTPENPSRHPGGKTPYGFYVLDGEYRWKPGHKGVTLVNLMRAHAQGDSFRALAQLLNAQRVEGPAGGEWHHSSVRRVVEKGKKLAHLIPIQYVI